MIRVLIVEDDPLIAAAHATYVERVEGFTVVDAVPSGSVPLRAASDANAPIDLVLLNVGFSGSDGVDIAASLVGTKSSPDVIAIMSVCDLPVVRSLIVREAVSYLLKPFTFAAFRDKLEQYKQVHAALPSARTDRAKRDFERARSHLHTSGESPFSSATPERRQRRNCVVKSTEPSSVPGRHHLMRLADKELVTLISERCPSDAENLE